MRVFCATLSHETNPHSPIPTNIESFREFYLYLPSTGEGAHYLDGPLEGVNLARYVKDRGHDVVCGLAASAQPSMPVNRRDYELLRDEMLTSLRNALPVDAVMLFLHGAQMAVGYDDCEGDLLTRIRALVGPDVPIGVEFDLHGNVTARMVEAADILVACKEYPHTDFEERCEHLLRLIERTVARQIRPAMHRVRIPMLGTYFTTRQPMRAFVDSLTALEGHDGVLSVSLCHGFSWAGTAETGATMIVVYDRNQRDEEWGRRIAGDCAQRFFALRDQVATRARSEDEALHEAEKYREYPVVIADMADNPGGGAPGDSTFLLEAMLARRMRDAALAMICDPVAVQTAMRAGVGASLPMRIGGKAGRASGRPLDVQARVIAVSNEASQMAQGMRMSLGPAAALEVAGIQIVLNSIRAQTFTPECFTALGIDPLRQKYLVVKSHQHFHEHFSQFAAHIIYASPPGTLSADFRTAPLGDVPRPVWPVDPTPFHAFGMEWG